MATPGGSVSDSGINYVDGLLWGVKWNGTPASPVTYYLTNANLTWNSTETTAVRNAFQAWSDVANISITSQSSYQANLCIYKGDDSSLGPGWLGYFTPPDSDQFPDSWGVGAFNADGVGWHAAGLQPGGIRELGRPVEPGASSGA